MFKKTITYTDFLDEERTEEFYFNISKDEILDLQIGTEGTFSARLEKVIASKNMRETLDIFKSFVKDSYGIRTPDGRGFIKSEAAWDAFKGSGAYGVMFIEFFEKQDGMAEFINGIMPAELIAHANAQIAAKEAGEEVPKAVVPTQNGFRPGAETLPKSRRDALAAEELRISAPESSSVAYKEPSMTAADAEELRELRAQLAIHNQTVINESK